MKKILIVGANGSTGAPLFKQLSKYYDAYGLIKKNNSKKKKYNFKNLKKKNIKFDTIVHLAGSNPHPYSTLSKKNMLKNNASINNKVLLLAKIKRVKKIIFFSSFSVYKKSRYINESSPISSRTMYAKSKIIFEHRLQNLNISTYVIRSCAILHSNSKNNWLSTLKDRVLLNQDITLYNKNNYYNNCIYIVDVINVIKKIISRSKIEKKTYNLSSNKPIKIKEIGKIIKGKKFYTGKICFKKDSKSFYFFNDSQYVQNDLGLNFKSVKEVIKKIFLKNKKLIN
jgi:nucleoside-diphosphate-sugar epimerase